jgi:hypothetical protein
MSSHQTFPSARAKIDRASEQTDILESEFEAFYADRAHSVREAIDPETGRKKAIFSTLPIPLRWGALIGEIVHDLRSALDSAVYDLTIAEQGGPLDRTEFPVFEDEGKYDQTTRKGEPAPGSGVFKVRGVNSRAKALIRQAQPFEVAKTSPPDRKPIMALVHELNIIDKHRTIHLMRQQTNEFSWRVLRDIQPISLAVIPAMEDGAEWGEWTPTVIDDQPDVEFNIAFELAFAETTPTLNGKGVIDVCRTLIQGVDRMAFFYLAGTLLPPPP